MYSTKRCRCQIKAKQFDVCLVTKRVKRTLSVDTCDVAAAAAAAKERKALCLLSLLGHCMNQCKKVKILKVHPFHDVLQVKTCIKTVLRKNCVKFDPSPPCLYIIQI